MRNKIVISGMSCRFPASPTYQTLWENLLSKKDMLTNDDLRWPAGSFGIPERFGKINTVDKFDAAFFGVHGKQADKMDPQLRLLLEVSYEAFIDAGIDPQDIKGSNTGVFTGACGSDMLSISGNNIESITGYENSGCSLSMFSNRLSFYYDFHGPSHTIDTACSSSIVALDSAITALEEGKCDYAIVSGTNVIFSPSISLGFSKLNMLSSTGSCKSFDQLADGYARSEGVGAIILTKESLARRIRARVHGSAINSDGYTEKGITFPNGNAQHTLLKNLYAQCNINPDDVSYIEAHGTGTAAGDPQEVNAIEQALNISQRSTDSPLYIGSVKSNMGHAEGAAGMAGIIKVLLCMEHGMIPANLHYSTPNENIAALHKGSIKVVDEHMQWNGGIVGINSFGFGGTNAHVILEGGISQNFKYQQTNNQHDLSKVLPPLIPCVARTSEAIDILLDSYTESDINLDAVKFMQSVANRDTEAFQYRGCLISNYDEKYIKNSPIKGKVVENPQEIWFVYPGMGSQWKGMGEELMSHPVFSSTIQTLNDVLKKTEIDLTRLLSKSEDDPFTAPTKTFVAITAIQLALTDMLTAYNIAPSGIVGHSVGEIACAYADGALTKEQAILVAYHRGKSVEQTPESRGDMIVAQMTWQDAQSRCTEDITLACHNSEYSVTFSGRQQAINVLIKSLQSEGIDVQQVNSVGIAFHSHLIEGAAPIFDKHLGDIITQPTQRSHRWISTSRTEDEWENATMCSAKYFSDNLLNPVLFHEALQHIPDNAIVIELGPHSLMRASLIESLNTPAYINIMRRDFNCQESFNNALAQAYVAGINIDWTGGIYTPTVQTGQISLPEMTGWAHSKSWKVPDLEKDILKSDGGVIYNIDLEKEEFSFFKDHKINNHIVVPATGYLYLVWKAVAKINNIPFNQLKIKFSDVHFNRATMLEEQNSVELKVKYFSATNLFEVTEKDDLVASGSVLYGDEIVLPEVDYPVQNKTEENIFLKTADIYKELRLRGYNYGESFREINKVSSDGCFVEIKWRKNWITFLDCMLHSGVVRFERKTLVPTYIRSLTIDPSLQSDKPVIELYSDKYIRCISSKAVVIEDCEFNVMPSSYQKNQLSLLSMEFVPFNQSNCIVKSDNFEVEEYIKVLRAHNFQQFSQLIEYARDKNISLPEHILKLRKVIESQNIPEVTSNKIEKYVNNPGGILIRLSQYVYNQPERLLEDAMPLIVSFDEYKDIYKKDIASNFLFSDRYLGSMMEIVLENNGVSRAINICEVGAGTGGLTTHILPWLRTSDDTYTITDISGGFFENLKKEFSSFSAVTKYESWNISDKVPENIGHNLDLVAASNVLHAAPNIKQALSNIHDSLTEGGFLLLHETTQGANEIMALWGFIEDIWNYDDALDRSSGAFLFKERWLKILDESGFEAISTHDDGLFQTLFLCRKKTIDATNIITLNINNIEQEVDTIQKHLSTVRDDENARLCMIGDHQSTPGLLGLINCVRKEGDGDRISAIYNSSDEQISRQMLDSAIKKNLAVSVYQNSQWGGYRYLDIQKNNSRLSDNAYIDIRSKGDLSTIHWISSPKENNINYEYDACYCALNFKDVMLAAGKLPDSAFEGGGKSLGGEFSGISMTGRRVMGFLSGPFSTKVQLDKQAPPYVWDVPDFWTLEQAATVPVAYMTAYLALVVRADIKAGQRVLIHSGTGGVGQASIRIALAKGCEIFTTVGSSQKLEVLHSLFPAIQADHIYSSRDTRFERQIMNVTRGKGVHVVLNSLADDKLQASLRVLSRYGQFLEIGKYDMTKNTLVGMQMYLRDVRFSGVGLNNVMRDDMPTLEIISALMKEGIESGVVVPLQRTVFDHDQIEQAFRFMATGKHTGKVLLKIRNEKLDSQACVSALPKFWCEPDCTYLITGGLGGFGFELARWLIDRGAKHITLTGRSGVKNAYQQHWLNIWKNKGISIVISHLDVSDEMQARTLITHINQRHTLKGIFHLAMVMEDDLLLNMKSEKFKHVVDIKYGACEYLDKLSRKLCPDLSEFVMFSSLSGAFGNPGQSAYGYANYAMDRLCERRKQQGLPGLSIQWGGIGDVGFINENMDYVNISAMRIKEQSLSSCLDTLGEYLLQDKPVVSSCILRNDIFEKSNNGSNSNYGEKTEETLLLYIKNILGISEEMPVSDDKKFNTLGMDSLMVVEIKGKLESDYGITLTLPAIQQLNFSTLKYLYNNRHNTDNDSGVATNMNKLEPENTKVNTDIKIFELISGNTDDTNIVYFLNGIVSDPVSIINDLDIPKSSSVYIIRYEQAGNMDNLADVWENHILEHEVSAKKIHIIGFSTGATIAHRFKKIKNLSHLSVEIKYTSISPPDKYMFESLREFSVEFLESVSKEDAMNELSTMPWINDAHIIDHHDIIDQLKFIISDHFYAKELSVVDTIVIPKDDPYCWTTKESESMASEVVSVAGRHDLRSFAVNEIMFG